MRLLFIVFAFILIGCNSDNPSFDKVIFHTSMCFGNCPVYHLELDKNKNVKLYTELTYGKNWEVDSSKMGYFEGLVSETTFEKLSFIIKTIGIDTLHFNNVLCCDGSVYTIIVYHNGKRKFLQSMTPPIKARELIMNLYEVCRKSNLKRTNKKFKIEYAYRPAPMKVLFPSTDSVKKKDH